MAHKLRTDLSLTFAGRDADFSPLIVEYEHRKAFNGGRSEPSTAEHVEIGLVYVEKDGARNPLPEWMIEAMTGDLEAMCLEDWRDSDAYGREQAAETRREMSRPIDAVKLAAAE